LEIQVYFDITEPEVNSTG